MADGSVIFDTQIDGSGIKTGLANLAKLAIGGKIVSELAQLGTAVIKVGADFEAQMSRVSAIAGVYGEDLKQLTELAKQLGADTLFSASEAAAGMENLASAGFSASEIMEAMPGLLDLAAVSGGDVANAAEVAASTLRAFGLEAEQASHVADVLAKAAAETNAEVGDMGYAMTYIAPVASAMGISLEETAAAIGILSDAGIKGTTAGTTLRSALSRLAKPSKQAADEMAALGLKFYDAQGKILPLKDQVSMLKDKLGGLSQQERDNALVTIYGQEALSGMLALMEAGPEKLDNLTTGFEDADGAAAQMAATINDNLQGDFEGLMGSLETLGISIFESFNEPLRAGVQRIDEFVNHLQTAFDEDGLSGLVSAFGAAIGEAVPQALAAGGQLVYQLLSGIVTNFPALMQGAMDAVNQFVLGVQTYLPVVVAAGSELLGELGSGIAQNLPSIVSQALDALMNFATTIYDNAPTIINAGFDLLSNLVQGILKSLPVLLSKGPVVISKFASVINDNFPTILAKGVQLIGQLAIGIVKAIPSLLANAGNILKALVDVFTAYNWLNLGKTIFTLFKNGITKMISAIRSSASSVNTNIIKTISQLPSKLKTLGKEAISFLGSGIRGMISSAVTAAKSVITSVVSSISGFQGQFVTMGKNLLQGLASGIGAAVGSVVSKAIEAAKKVVNSVKNFFGIASPSKLFKNLIGKNLMLGLAEGIEDETSTALASMGKAAKEIGDVKFDTGDVEFFDPDALYAKVSGTVSAQKAQVTAAKAAESNAYSESPEGNGGSDNDKNEPRYVETTINIDGKKAARVLTPYISKEMHWEGK